VTAKRPISWPALLAGALSGVLVAAVALGVAQLAAGITGALGSPIDAIGEDLRPLPARTTGGGQDVQDARGRHRHHGHERRYLHRQRRGSGLRHVLTANATVYIIGSVLMTKSP